MRTKIALVMYLSFMFTGVWLIQAKAPVLKEDAWSLTIK